MKNIIEALRASSLFCGCSEEQLRQLPARLELKAQRYQKDEFILHQGEKPKGIGIVLSGRLHILREDYLGNREILAEAGPAEIFDEVYGVLADEPQRVAVVAAADSQAAFFTVKRFLAAGRREPVLMENLLRVLAQKNLFLTTKMAHLSKRTIREKVISYLSEESSRRGSLEFSIPFNRQQLADYLAAERSALSRELSRMQQEGLIEFHKNRFVLK